MKVLKFLTVTFDYVQSFYAWVYLSPWSSIELGEMDEGRFCWLPDQDRVLCLERWECFHYVYNQETKPTFLYHLSSCNDNINLKPSNTTRLASISTALYAMSIALTLYQCKSRSSHSHMHAEFHISSFTTS